MHGSISSAAARTVRHTARLTGEFRWWLGVWAKTKGRWPGCALAACVYRALTTYGRTSCWIRRVHISYLL
jgi:hypothetical protein